MWEDSLSSRITLHRSGCTDPNRDASSRKCTQGHIWRVQWCFSERYIISANNIRNTVVLDRYHAAYIALYGGTHGTILATLYTRGAGRTNDSKTSGPIALKREKYPLVGTCTIDVTYDHITRLRFWGTKQRKTTKNLQLDRGGRVWWPTSLILGVSWSCTAHDINWFFVRS